MADQLDSVLEEGSTDFTADQLASVPEESSTDSTALSPRCYSYRESFLSVDGPKWIVRSTISSQSGQSGSNHSSISASSGAPSCYLFNISGAVDFGADELHQRPPSIDKVICSSLAKQLASMSEESTTASTAPCPPSNSYRESIRSVAWPEWRNRWTLSSQSGESGSNYSSSYLSSISGYSVGSASASAGTADLGAEELTKIAHRMVSEGYTHRMIQAFGYAGGQDSDLETWFAELDISWVLPLRAEIDRWGHPQLKDTSTSSLQELAGRWIRALTIIVASIKELVAAVNATVAVGWFGKASISAMLVFVDAFVRDCKVGNLHTLLQMYLCVRNASYDILSMHVITSDAQRIFKDIGSLLERNKSKLSMPMYEMMRGLKYTIMRDEDNDCWASEITQGRGEVHKNTRMMVDCIGLMRKAQASEQSHDTARFSVEIGDMIDCLKGFLLTKSVMCSDLSLGYLFLLNNSYFVAQVSGQGLELTPECASYMDTYIKVSWEDVLSCLSSSNLHGPLRRWINTSSLTKFQLAFHKTYLAQKFWKVPDPQLRDALRRAITERVISAYRNYLKENPELEKQVSSGSNSPEILEEMLGEIFEG